MDQDSAFESEDAFLLYKNDVEKLIIKDRAAVSFGPLIKNINKTDSVLKKIRKNILSPLKKKVRGKKYVPSAMTAEQKCRLIASANIISIKAWEDAGGFDENLIISEVDYDFCYKLVRLGYKLIRLNNHTLIQRAGEKMPFHALPKFLNRYTDSRFYYSVRNAFVMKSRYPEYSRFYNGLIRKLFWDYCINSIHILRHFRLWKKAKQDAKQFR